MFFLQYEPYDLLEYQKVVSFCRTQGMLLKEWNDDFIQFIQRAYAVLKDIFPMIVMPPIAINVPASEELF